MFPALKVLERQTPPLKYGAIPYWRAPICPASETFYSPVWNWVNPRDLPEGEAVTVLDVNAAYLAAIGQVEIAHSELVHRGAWQMDVLPEVKDIRPGYYRITVPYWAFDATIVHPLGDSTRVVINDTLWVAAPTLQLLLDLLHEGHLGHFEILDSWSATRTTHFHKWAERLRSLRAEQLDALAMAQTELHRREVAARLAAFKTGYSAALSMMLTGEKCLARRPDWSHTVYALHAANTWRKAWRWTYSGRPLVSMGSVDEISVFSVDLPHVLAQPKPPFRLDPSGMAPGAFKPKKLTFVGDVVTVPEPQSLAFLADSDDLGDVL